MVHALAPHSIVRASMRRDPGSAHVGRDIASAPIGRDIASAPIGRDPASAPIGRDPASAPIGRDTVRAGRIGTALCIAAGAGLAVIGLAEDAAALPVGTGAEPAAIALAAGAGLAVAAWLMRPSDRMRVGACGLALVGAVAMMAALLSGADARPHGVLDAARASRLAAFALGTGLVDGLTGHALRAGPSEAGAGFPHAPADR